MWSLQPHKAKLKGVLHKLTFPRLSISYLIKWIRSMVIKLQLELSKMYTKESILPVGDVN